ncbi:MAG: hypothetical protein LBP21_08405 [Synergistaceae bacterium]|nr:hypothetical protein [Synergistaceae bacterium]
MSCEKLRPNFDVAGHPLANGRVSGLLLKFAAPSIVSMLGENVKKTWDPGTGVGPSSVPMKFFLRCLDAKEV